MKRPVQLRVRHMMEGYSFILPWIVGFLLFMAIPLAKSLKYGFFDLKITKSGLQETYVGLSNFRKAFTVDVEFVPKLVSTLSTVITQVPLILIFAMFCALMLNRPIRGRIVFRGIFFMPVIIASGAVLQKLIEQGATMMPVFNEYNLAEKLINYVPPQILLPLLDTMNSLTLVMWDSGVQILIFLAGLQSIPASLYEAAKCDGATPWESFWKITFPMITPMILVNTLFSIVNSFTKVNNDMMKFINDTVFKKTDYGYAAAIGWIYFIVIFIVIMFVFYVFRHSAAYERERR